MAKENKTISVIIPTYNRGKSLKKVILSYLSQKFVKEIIIVDDGSTDETESLIKTFQKENPNIKYIKHSSNRGQAASKNEGVKQASGRYVLFGEDDVIFSNNYAEQLLECIIKHKKAGAVAGRLVYLKKNETQEGALRRTQSLTGPIINRYMLAPKFYLNPKEVTKLPYLHACALVKKEALDQVMFDEGYKVNALREETDFFINLNKNGFETYLCPHTSCFHLPRTRSQGGSWKSGILTYQYWAIKNNYRFIKKHYSFLKNNPGLKGNIYTFMFLHILNRLRHLILYFWRSQPSP